MKRFVAGLAVGALIGGRLGVHASVKVIRSVLSDREIAVVKRRLDKKFATGADGEIAA